jgi:hypothetical protein
MRLLTLGWLELAVTTVAAHAHDVPHFPLHRYSRRQVNTTSSTNSSIVTNTTSAANSSITTNTTSTANSTINTNVQSTILVIVRTSTDAYSATSGLNAYGIPYQVLLVPQSGVTLPVLNTTSGGNFGGFIIASQVSYDYGATGWASALTNDQYNQIYTYQIAYGVRMIQYDAYPQPAYGVSVLGGCCNTGTEQLFSFTNTSSFSQAGIRSWAGVSSQGLYHYAAHVSDPTTTYEIAQFAANANFASNSTAAVINNFNGRQQMVIFMSWATQWSSTCNFVQHAYITWMTRGLYTGYRRVNLNTQVDDMFLSTDLYYPATASSYRTTPLDLSAIASWVPTINKKMNSGSSYKPEIGHNGNGNLIAALNSTWGPSLCGTGPVYTGDYNDTALEFIKPLGTGINEWPLTPIKYAFSTVCDALDPLAIWWAKASNRDAFTHISHTFTHYHLDNATYADTYKEITFNQAWLKQVGIASGAFSANGLIPPAITGLHNGDAINAWVNAGLTNAVGDNSRPLLMSTLNEMYAYITTNASNGYAGFQVIPRWPTRIYYNCDTPACTLQEWTVTSAGTGDFSNLMANERSDTMRHLFGLHYDGYMFHQANLRATGVSPITNPDGSTVNSLIQAWVEVVVAEFSRLVNWPMITYKQSDLSVMFANRAARDACNYQLSWSKKNTTITGVTVTANGNTCSAAIPVTVPGTVTNTQGFVTEKFGNDPLTIWVKLKGSPVSFNLTSPVQI